MGIRTILFAVVLGYGTHMFTGKQIIAGFSGSLFLTLAGVTLLFSIVWANGALELLMKKIIAKTGKMVVLVPAIFFAFSWVVSAAGPGLIPTAALVALLAIPIAHETGYSPVMLAIIGVHAAFAVASVLILLKVCDESEAIRGIPWSTILRVEVAQGTAVKERQLLVVLEAMKMENEILAPKDGTVAQVVVQKGSHVEAGSPLIVLA